jgi:hypothetical protein
VDFLTGSKFAGSIYYSLAVKLGRVGMIYGQVKGVSSDNLMGVRSWALSW